jgi:hypothetical protein
VVMEFYCLRILHSVVEFNWKFFWIEEHHDGFLMYRRNLLAALNGHVITTHWQVKGALKVLKEFI